jgi:branched-chain amino acid transport system permease protein
MQALVSGIAAGAAYSLVALGFSLIYRTTRVLNFAQGDLAALAGYIALAAVGTGMPLLVAMLLGVLATAALTGVIERLALRPLYRRPVVLAILATVGLSVLLQSGLQLTWGSTPLLLDSIAPGDPWRIAGISITPAQLVIIVIGVALSGALLWAIDFTKLGRAMRGCAQDPYAVSLLGVSPDRMYFGSFVIGGLLAGVAGILVMPEIGLLPTRGLNLTVIGFAAAVFGGLGSLPGAVLGGTVIAILINLVAVYVSPDYSMGVAYLIIIGVLLFRVRGLLGDDIEAVRTV